MSYVDISSWEGRVGHLTSEEILAVEEKITDFESARARLEEQLQVTLAGIPHPIVLLSLGYLRRLLEVRSRGTKPSDKEAAAYDEKPGTEWLDIEEERFAGGSNEENEPEEMSHSVEVDSGPKSLSAEESAKIAREEKLAGMLIHWDETDALVGYELNIWLQNVS